MDNKSLAAIVIASMLCSLMALYISKEDKEQKFELTLKSDKIDTSSFYWSAKDATSVKQLKNKHTSVVVADSFNYKAWSIDIQEYVAPFDTIDWCRMEIISYNKKG